MPIFSKSSLAKLDTCDRDLQTVMLEVVKYFDYTVLYGHRTKEEQLELFKKGRKEVKSKWVICNKKEVVTYKDGFENLSKHNAYPSKAIDIVPYPINWEDTDRMIYLAGFVMATAKIFKSKGIIDNNIYWGGDWNNDTLMKDERFIDLYHFEIR